MPSSTIEVRRTYSLADEISIVNAVHAAIVDAFQIPSRARNVILTVHQPHRFPCPPDCEDPDRFTNVNIFARPGRTLAAKRKLYKGVVDRLELLGIPGSCVLIKFHELAAENIAVRGGQALCDLDLGYPVNV